MKMAKKAKRELSHKDKMKIGWVCQAFQSLGLASTTEEQVQILDQAFEDAWTVFGALQEK